MDALGPRPELDPARNVRHGRLVGATDRVRVDELREDHLAAEDAAEDQPAPWLMTMGIAAAITVEAAGALLLARSLGLSSFERIPLGAGLGAGLIALTLFIGHRSAKVALGGARSALAARIGHVILRLLAIAAYVVVVAAVSVVRMREAGDDDASTTVVLAETALYVLMSMGPAWIVAWLAAKRAPAKASRNRVRTLVRRLRRAERARERAVRAIERITMDGARWDAEAARLRARYRTEYRLESARLQREREEKDARERADVNS